MIFHPGQVPSTPAAKPLLTTSPPAPTCRHGAGDVHEPPDVLEVPLVRVALGGVGPKAQQRHPAQPRLRRRRAESSGWAGARVQGGRVPKAAQLVGGSAGAQDAAQEGAQGGAQLPHAGPAYRGRTASCYLLCPCHPPAQQPPHDLSFIHSLIHLSQSHIQNSFIHSAPPARWPRCAPRGRAGPPTPPAHPPSPAPAGTGSHPCRAPVGTAGTAGDSGSQGTGPANSASRMGSCKCHMGTCLPGSAASHLCMQQSQTNGPARHTTARQCSTQNALLTGSTWLFQEVTSVTLFHSSYCQTRVRLRRPGGRECSKDEDPAGENGAGMHSAWRCGCPPPCNLLSGAAAVRCMPPLLQISLARRPATSCVRTPTSPNNFLQACLC